MEVMRRQGLSHQRELGGVPAALKDVGVERGGPGLHEERHGLQAIVQRRPTPIGEMRQPSTAHERSETKEATIVQISADPGHVVS